MRFDRRRWGACTVVAAMLAGAACSRAPRELLFVYSGDCQGYVDPCG